MEDPALLDAYLSYYWPVSYAQASRVMDICGLRPARVLDLGAGPGPMTAAAFDRGATRLCLVDHSSAALNLAERLLVDPKRFRIKRENSPPDASVKRANGNTAPNYDSQQSGLPAIQCIQANLEAPEAILPGPFDLVILGHCLNEIAATEPERMTRVKIRAALVVRTAQVLAPGGSVMIIDPATLAAARDGMALRDYLSGLGWQVKGPCTRQEPCPALAAGENQSCHDEAPWAMPEVVKRLAKGAGLDRELIKMFWLVLQPPAPGQAGESHASGSQTFRVVSEPMLNKAGRVRYLLCGEPGRFPFSAKRDDQAAKAGGFFDLNRYDLIQVEAPESREGGGWGYGTETRLRLILPSGNMTGRIDP